MVHNSPGQEEWYTTIHVKRNGTQQFMSRGMVHNSPVKRNGTQQSRSRGMVHNSSGQEEWYTAVQVKRNGTQQSGRKSKVHFHKVGQVLLEELFPRHNCPLQIVTGNGTENENRVTRETLQVSNIDHVTMCTQQSPFFLLRGRDPVSPLDNILKSRRRYMGEELHKTDLENLHKPFTQVYLRPSQERKLQINPRGNHALQSNQQTVLQPMR